MSTKAGRDCLRRRRQKGRKRLLPKGAEIHFKRHIKQHMDLANHIAKGEKEKAATIKTFYDEYFAVMDLPAEFYIETVRDVFQEHTF